MDEKYLWPLVGVALGWALSLVSAVVKDRGDRRRQVGVLVAKLLLVREQVVTLKRVVETVKDRVDDWAEFETMRRSITQRHFLEPASHVESLRKVIDDVSGYYPVQALSLHGLVDTLLKNKNASFANSVKSHELYIHVLSVYEVGLDWAERQLDRNIRSFSGKHGVTTYLLVQWNLHRRSQAFEKNKDFYEKSLSETWAGFRGLSQVGRRTGGDSGSSQKSKSGQDGASDETA